MKATQVRCAECGTALGAGVRFCVACGAPAASAGDVPAEPRSLKTRMLDQLREATLGEYEILIELGSGGMATVYLAHDLMLDRKVAIKLMHPTLLVGDDMVERFILEARTAAGLSHSSIVPIYAVKMQEDLLYFVMKFVEGRPLDSIIKAEAPLDADTVRHIMTEMADALGYAHRQGVVHRDIKPANIIISTDGHPFLADFGIAKVADKPGLTLTGATIGTPAYMSPEQCNAQQVTGASDQYSLGVTAFEMLTGKPPFDAPSYMAIMVKQMSQPAPTIQETVAACPTDLATTVDRMLAKEPDDRFPSMEAVVETLRAGTVTSFRAVRTQLVEFALADPRRALVQRVSTPRSPIPTAARRARITAESPASARTSLRPAIIGGAVVAALAIGAFVLGQRGGRDQAPAAATGVGAAPPAVIPTDTGIGAAPAAPTAQMAPVEAPPEPAPPTAAKKPIAPTPGRIAAPVVSTLRIVGPESLSAGSGGTMQVEARDASGAIVNDRSVAWTSNAPGVVSIGAGGRLHAEGEGQAVITATVDGVSQQRAVSVSAEPVGQVRIDPAVLSMAPGEAAALTARITGTSGRALDRDVRWSSTAPAIATVAPSGRVTAIAPGSATIHATSASQVGNATITVTTPAAAPAAAAGPTAAEVREQVVATINAYARALESRDLTRVRHYYPTMPPDREQALRDALPTMGKLQVRLDAGQVQTAASTATAQVTGSFVFTSKGQRTTLPVNETYRLERQGTGWVITEIR